MKLAAVTAVAAIGTTMGVTMAVPTAAYADTTPVTSATACGSLPSYVDGRPAHLHARAAAGDYLWHDSNGWHLRVTHPTTSRTVFRGVITSSSPITFQRVRDERHDSVTLSSDKRTLVFRFVNHGGIDGVDFADSCAATTKFALSRSGHLLGRNHIYIGANSARPSHDPFVISRADARPAA